MESLNKTNSRVITGRISNETLYGCHRMCIDMGIPVASHWQAIRAVLDVTIRSIHPNLDMVDQEQMRNALDLMGQQKMRVSLTPADITTAMMKFQSNLEISRLSGKKKEPS